jgi:hypothetical protein
MSDQIDLSNDGKYQQALEEFRIAWVKGQELAEIAGSALNDMIKILLQQKRDWSIRRILMQIAGDLNLKGFSSRNLHRYLSDENRNLLQNNRLKGDKRKLNKKSIEQSSISNTTSAVSPSITGKFIADSSDEVAMLDAMIKVDNDETYNKIKELQDLIKRHKGFEQLRENEVESETMRNSNAKTSNQNFVMLNCGKFHRELGRIYMRIDTHKLIFDDNYQVIAIE